MGAFLVDFEGKASFFWKTSWSLLVRHKNYPSVVIVLSKYRVLAIFFRL